MPGIADLLYLGAPDPRRQLAAMLAGQQAQGGPPQGAGPTVAPPAAAGPAAPPAGPAAAPPGGDPNAPAPNAQSVSADGSQPPANPVAPGAAPPPGSQPQPTVLQSSPDMSASYNALANPPNLMSLYLQLDARNRASDQINHGLALIAANHSSPGMARAIMESVSGGANAGQQVGDLMSLYNAQNQMQGQQAMLAQADAIDQKNGWPPGTSRAMILAGRGSEIIQDMKPTDMQRNWEWAKTEYKKDHPDASADDIEQGAQGILLGVGGMGGGDADTKSWRAAKIQWDQNPATKGQPYPWGTGADDNPTRFRAWSGTQVEQDKALAADQGEAAKMGPIFRGNLQGVRDRIANIIGIQADGSIDSAREAQLKSLLGTDMAQKYINSDPTKEGTWGQDLASWWGGLKPEDQALLTQIRDATNPNQRLGSPSKPVPKRGVSNVADIGFGLDGMRNVTQGYDDWITGAKNTLKAIDGATVNSFGAQGTPEAAEDYARQHHMPVDEALSLMDDNYLSGGSLYPKGKIAGSMSQPQIDAATAAIRKADDPEAERQKQIKLALIRNTDPTPLKNLRP